MGLRKSNISSEYHTVKQVECSCQQTTGKPQTKKGDAPGFLAKAKERCHGVARPIAKTNPKNMTQKKDKNALYAPNLSQNSPSAMIKTQVEERPTYSSEGMRI